MCRTSRGKYSVIGRPFTITFPVPSFMRTRAIAVLRLPVAVTMGSASGKGELLRLLGRVRMGGAAVDLELAVHAPAERVGRQHAPHRLAHDAIRVRAREQLVGRRALQVAHPAGVADV